MDILFRDIIICFVYLHRVVVNTTLVQENDETSISMDQERNK
jgi:hypothetical protein